MIPLPHIKQFLCGCGLRCGCYFIACYLIASGLETAFQGYYILGADELDDHLSSYTELWLWLKTVLGAVLIIAGVLLAVGTFLSNPHSQCICYAAIFLFLVHVPILLLGLAHSIYKESYDAAFFGITFFGITTYFAVVVWSFHQELIDG